MDDDNSGYNYSGYESAFVPTGSTAYADETPQQTAPTGTNSETSNTGTTQAGKPGDKLNGYGIGSRPYNPLSAYSSYTYQISLYMITPDAYDEFNRSGRKNIYIINGENGDSTYGSGGAYLLAQSGGINNDSTRAPGFEYDYYIDNLQLTAAAAGPDAGNNGSTVNYELQFTITESYGFSLVTAFKTARKALEKYTSTTNYKDALNASRQFFILGIRFLGYDAAGNLITESPLVNEPDPTFQRFYDIELTKIQFKIDGKTTTYRVTAAQTTIKEALGTKRGVIDKGANQLVGTTVGDILRQLMAKITEDQTKDAKADPQKREFPNTYDIKFIGDAVDIENSSIVSSADVSKIKWPMGAPTDKTTVNPGLEIKAQPNSKERIMAFNRDTPIIQAITSVITQSDYLQKGLQAVYTTEEQPNAKSDSQDTVQSDSNKRLKWFSIVPSIEKTKFDNILKDWVFHITYYVKTYEIPIIKSAYADNTTPYYGPVKRYEYWWTGKNSEVIKYEAQLDNTYYTVALSGQDANSATTAGNAQVPIALGKRQNTDRAGKLDVGKEAQNSIQTDLTGGDWHTATIEILGDPDYLSNPLPTGDETSKSFYGPDGYTVDYSSGQVFIEIKFIEPVDYNHNNGLMRLNPNILFWDYPVAVAEKLKGAMCYKLLKVVSNFRGGKFTQVLTATHVEFGEVGGPKMRQAEAEERENQEITDNEMKRLKGRTTGLTADPAASPGTTGGNQTVGSDSPPSTQSTTSGGVANDDASASAPGTATSYYDDGRGP